MGTTFSILRCTFFTLLLLAATPLTVQAQLVEYPLPAGSLPLQIDASSPAGLVYFVDRAPAPPTIDQLNPAGTLTFWPSPFTPTVPGSIVVDQLTATQFVYVTDLFQNTLGQLDVINNIYNKYNLTLLPFNILGGPRQLVYDTSWSVEPSDLVWFCTSGATGTGSVPMIGYFNPTTFMFRVWFLPPSVASPGESIDGLAFNVNAAGTPTVYFAVNGPLHNNISTLLPLAGGFVSVWPLPATYTQPVPIVANTQGEVFRVQCTAAGCNTHARLRTGANMLDQWLSVIDTTPDLFVTLDPVASVSRFTALRGAAPTSDLLQPDCPANVIPVQPYFDYAQNTFYPLYPERIQVPPMTVNAPPMNSILNGDAHCPFFRNVQISSGGPISMDPGNNTWISESSSQRIATHP